MERGCGRVRIDYNNLFFNSLGVKMCVYVLFCELNGVVIQFYCKKKKKLFHQRIRNFQLSPIISATFCLLILEVYHYQWLHWLLLVHVWHLVSYICLQCLKQRIENDCLQRYVKWNTKICKKNNDGNKQLKVWQPVNWIPTSIRSSNVTTKYSIPKCILMFFIQSLNLLDW